MNRQNPCIYDVDAGRTSARKPVTQTAPAVLRVRLIGVRPADGRNRFRRRERQRFLSVWIIYHFSVENNSETF